MGAILEHRLKDLHLTFQKGYPSSTFSHNTEKQQLRVCTASLLCAKGLNIGKFDHLEKKKMIETELCPTISLDLLIQPAAMALTGPHLSKGTLTRPSPTAELLQQDAMPSAVSRATLSITAAGRMCSWQLPRLDSP